MSKLAVLCLLLVAVHSANAAKCYISAPEGGYNVHICPNGCNNRTYLIKDDHSFIADCAQQKMPADQDPQQQLCTTEFVEQSCDCYQDYCNCNYCYQAGIR